MKKRNLIGALLCSACLVAVNAVPAMADAVRVVTLGADLTEDQKNTMMRYFQVDSNQVQIGTITKQDERDQLSADVPLEQIRSLINGFMEELETRYSDVLAEVQKTGDLGGVAIETVRAALAEYKSRAAAAQ